MTFSRFFLLVAGILALGLSACSFLNNEDAENSELIHYHIDMKEANLTVADSVTVDIWQNNKAEAEHQLFTDMDNVIPDINAPESTTITLLARVYEGGGIVGTMIHAFVAGRRINSRSITPMDFTTERFVGVYQQIPVLDDFTGFGFTSATCSADGAGDAGNCSLYFATPGDHGYTITYSDDQGHLFRENMTVHILQGLPTVDSCTDLFAYINNMVTFDVCNASDDYSSGILGGIALYLWDYNGDGIDDDSSSLTTYTHVYSDISSDTTYTAQLTIRDYVGNKTNAMRRVHVMNRAPTLGNLVISNTTPVLGQTITIVAPSLSDFELNQVDSLWWDLDGDGSFDDANTGLGVTLRDSFPNPVGGSYVIAVQAKDKWGLYDTTSEVVTVYANRAPFISIQASDATPVTGQTITISAYYLVDLDSNLVDSLWWDLDGDGVYETKATSDKAQTLTKDVLGKFTVSAYAWDAEGLKDTSKLTLSIMPGFIDSRDGQPYTTTMIGTQNWMGQNLNYVPASDSSLCYDNEESNCTAYGRLYGWTTAMGVASTYNSAILGDSINHQGICPNGWHIPSSSEWTTLVNYVGGSSTAGTQLLGSSFSALLGGYYYSEFNGLGVIGKWWSATENGETKASALVVMSSITSVGSGYNDKKYRLSLRCLQD